MSKKKKQMSGEDRKASILEAGARLAAKHGAINVTRRMVAEAAKVSEALVSAHMGDTKTAQAAYKRQMKKLGLEEPSKDKIEAIGVKLRAHGPRDKRDTRKRSAKEVEAIKRKASALADKMHHKRPAAKTAKSRRSGVDLQHTVATPGPKAKLPSSAPDRLISLARAAFALKCGLAASTESLTRLTSHSRFGSTIDRWISLRRPLAS